MVDSIPKALGKHDFFHKVDHLTIVDENYAASTIWSGDLRAVVQLIDVANFLGVAINCANVAVLQSMCYG